MTEQEELRLRKASKLGANARHAYTNYMEGLLLLLDEALMEQFRSSPIGTDFTSLKATSVAIESIRENIGVDIQNGNFAQNELEKEK